MQVLASAPSGKAQEKAGTACDVVIVGAGAAGLYALYRMLRRGENVRLFEAGDDVGGTWYWNSYPGARVDIPSFEYSYSFDAELQKTWRWSEKYSAQPELQKYFRHVVDRYDMGSHITFNTRVESAHFDEAEKVWHVRTDTGEEVACRYLILATGPLSEPLMPKVEGLERFEGVAVHSGRWPRGGLDVKGKRVAVIGTGSTGAQVSPELAKEADRLFLLQRTAAYSVPSQNQPLSDEETREIIANYDALRERARRNRSCLGIDVSNQSALSVDDDERQRIYDKRWQMGGLGFTAAFGDIYSSVEANATAAEFVRQKIREIVRKPELVGRLMPDTLIGAKRLCVDNGYFQMFNRDNVELVDISENPITCITENGVQLAQGEIDLDVIVFATGFDAITGALMKMDIRGRNGETLRDAWRDGPETFLGMGTAGFPNLFLVNGPGSPAGLANMVTLAENNVDWIADCLDHMEKAGFSLIEADADAQSQWGEMLTAMADETIYPLANSWYVGANVPGKPRRFVSHLDYPEYMRACASSARNGYSGFRLS